MILENTEHVENNDNDESIGTLFLTVSIVSFIIATMAVFISSSDVVTDGFNQYLFLSGGALFISSVFFGWRAMELGKSKMSASF